jgi:hypothetical protein
MKRRQLISLGFGIFILLVILLSLIKASAQVYSISEISGTGFRGLVNVYGYMLIQSDSTIIINTDYGKLLFKYTHNAEVSGLKIYNLESYASKQMIWIDQQSGVITLNRRYRGRPEQTIKYTLRKP